MVESKVRGLIEYARSRGLSNGSVQGFHSGMMDEVADCMEEMLQIIIDKDFEIIGIMHSVDKWLEGDELKQNTVDRASDMREKTLRIIEDEQRRRIDTIREFAKRAKKSASEGWNESIDEIAKELEKE